MLGEAVNEAFAAVHPVCCHNEVNTTGLSPGCKVTTTKETAPKETQSVQC